MDIYYALAEPTRREIIEIVAHKGEVAATDICSHFDMSFAAISQHLKVLKEANIVTSEKRAQKRIYKFNPTSLKEFQDWKNKLQSYWEDRFDSLDKLLEIEKQKQKRKSSRKSARGGLA